MIVVNQEVLDKKARRRAMNNAARAAKKARETPEQRRIRLEGVSRRNKAWRERNPDRKRELGREYMQRKRGKESEEEKRARNRREWKQKLARESEDLKKREARLARLNAFYASRIQSESPEEREARLAKQRAAGKKWNAANGPDYYKKRISSDPAFLVAKRLRNRAAIFLGKRGGPPQSYSNLFGCTREHLARHLESQFADGMSWENRGEWHIDHIYPVARIDVMNELEVAAVFNWRNVQPLWASDNSSKNGKVTAKALALFESIKKILSTPEE